MSDLSIGGMPPGGLDNVQRGCPASCDERRGRVHPAGRTDLASQCMVLRNRARDALEVQIEARELMSE